MTLDTVLGWSVGDDLRVLTAAGIPVGVYQVREIQLNMNHLGAEIDGFVDGVLTILDDYDRIQTVLVGLNRTSGGKTLVKADVLEWEAGGPGRGYGPEHELGRIVYRLKQYFASSPLFNVSNDVNTALIRS